MSPVQNVTHVPGLDPQHSTPSTLFSQTGGAQFQKEVPAVGFDDVIRQTVRDVLREELRDLVAESKPAAGDGPLMTVADAAQYARVHEDTIRTWLRHGKLQRFKAGRELRVRRDDLERFLAAASNESELTAEEAVSRALRR